MISETLRTMTRRSVPVVLLAALPLLGACDETTPTGNDGIADDTRVSIYLTDAPGDVDSVWVQVDDVVLVGDEEQVSLLDEPTELLNVTALQDSATALVEDREIEPGTYGQLRFIIGGAVLQTIDEQVYTSNAEHPHDLESTGTLHCPSCAQTGIKVVLRGATFEEGDHGVLIDFDVTQSFGHQAGRSGRWIMHPVIHASVTEPDAEPGEAFGTIVGTVALDEEVEIPECAGSERTLEEFVPLAVATTLTDDEDDPIQRSGTTDDEGDFEIEVLEADTYTLGYLDETSFEDASLVWQADVDPAEATIEEEGDEVAGVVYTVTDVSCEVPEDDEA